MEFIEPGPDDWAAFRDLRLRALRDAPLAFLEKLAHAERLTEREWRDRLREAPPARTLIVRESGEWLGMSRLKPDELDPTTAWLVAVWLDPRLRGTGAAERMLAEQLDWARTGMRVARVRLHVGGSNGRARALYERLGFRATGAIDTFPGHDEDEHVLELAL